MIIDWQHHFTPQEIVNKRRGPKRVPSQPVYDDKGRVVTHYRPEMYDIDKHLEWMDAAGIDIAVLSSPGCRTLEDCIIIDDALGSIVEKHPNRFVGLARCIPTLGEESLKELDRAINVLGLRGVCIDAQIEGHELDSGVLWPFYEMVSRLDIPIFVHIAGTRDGYEAFDTKYNLVVTLGTMVLDLSATVRIILGGVLAKFPDLKFVISHMGGGISAIKERFVRYVNIWGRRFWTDLGDVPPFGEPFGENFNKCFNKLYFDMAGYEGGMNAVKCALTTIKPARLLFATDYPLNFTGDASGVAEYIKNIKRLNLARGAVEAILGGTAAKLLRI